MRSKQYLCSHTCIHMGILMGFGPKCKNGYKPGDTQGKYNLGLALENFITLCVGIALSRMVFVKPGEHETSSDFHGYNNIKAIFSMASKSETHY